MTKDTIDKQCVYCGAKKSLLMDHFIPKSITRADIYLVPACSRCNFSKRNLHPKTWFFHHVRDNLRWHSILCQVGLSESEIDLWMKPKLLPVRIVSKLPELMETRQGLDQKTLAAKTGLSPTTVGKLYRGHFDRIDNHTVTTLCRFFGLKSINELIEIEWEDADIEGMGA